MREKKGGDSEEKQVISVVVSEISTLCISRWKICNCGIECIDNQASHA